MNRLKALLGTTALVGAGLLGTMPIEARAATVSPGGALDLTLTGFLGFRAHGGDINDARLTSGLSDGLDFSNDTEVHVVARGRHDATGIEYGATVEFEADTNRTDNTDETWIFVRGTFGEFRFGDEDGVVDNSAVGGFTVGAGTGGIDGSIVDAIGTGVVKPYNSGDDTKIRYYTPSFGGFSVGVSYTPNNDGGDSIASTQTDPQDLVEGALVYNGEIGGVGILASAVGSFCRIENEGAGQDDDCWTWGAGAVVNLFGFRLAGGFFSQDVGPSAGGGSGDKDFFNLGVATTLGPVNLSVTYGQVLDSNDLVVNGNELDEPMNLVFSADIGLMPGLVLAGDIGYFDNDVDVGPNKDDDDGYQAVTRLRLAF
jgi:outer membrane protein OmpU